MINVFVFIRFFSELSLWFGCAGLILSLFTSVSPPIYSLLILSTSAVVANLLGQKQEKLRYWGIVILLCLIPFCKSIGDILLNLPVLFYVVKAILQNEVIPSQNDTFYRFRSVCIIAFIGAIACIAFKHRIDFLLCVFSAVFHLFLTRMLRHQPEDLNDKKLISLEFGLLAIICLLGYLCSQDLLLHAAYLFLKWIYKVLIGPLIVVLWYPLFGILWVINWLASMVFSGEIESFSQDSMSSMMESVPEEILQAESSGSSVLLLLMIRLLGIAIFLGVGFFIMKFFLKKKENTAKVDSDDMEFKRDIAITDIPENNTPPSFLDRSPEANVRRAYAQLCKWIENSPEKLQPHDTTRSVNRRTILENDPNATELRNLYIRARYHKENHLTNEDARRANILVRTIVKSKK